MIYPSIYLSIYLSIYNMVADAFSRPVGIPVVASPGSCSGSSVSPVFWSFLEPQAQGLVSSVHSPNVSPTLAQLINYSNLAQLQKHCSETQDLSKLAGSGWLHHLTLVLLRRMIRLVPLQKLFMVLL